MCRISCPRRHWRPRGRSVGRAEPVLPLADRRQHRVLFGAGCQCTRPACAPSAGPAQCAGSPAARGCDGCGVTGQGTASLPPVAPRGLLDAGDCSLLHGPRAVQVGPVLRPGPVSRVAAPECPPHSVGQWPANQASGCNPTYGQEYGQVAQYQSELGGRVQGPDDDHGMRAEPCLLYGQITVSATSRQVQALHKRMSLH